VGCDAVQPVDDVFALGGGEAVVTVVGVKLVDLVELVFRSAACAELR